MYGEGEKDKKGRSVNLEEKGRRKEGRKIDKERKYVYKNKE